jgi:hypothetical protein
MPTVLVRPLLGFCRAADRLTWVAFIDIGPECEVPECPLLRRSQGVIGRGADMFKRPTLTLYGPAVRRKKISTDWW